MKLFGLFGKKGGSTKELPWYGRPSIYAHLAANQNADGTLNSVGLTLPDNDRIPKISGVGFAPGARDGIASHHVEKSEKEELVQQVTKLVGAIARTDNQSKKIELYNLLLQDNLLAFLDSALRRISEQSPPVQPHLYDFVHWLAFKSPDRGPVKFGIALLGRLNSNSEKEKLLTLGKHDEFTLFAAVAIGNHPDNGEVDIWELAKGVKGWGRIHLVERLLRTDDPQIKKWLLLEGYDNYVMHEYLALDCAIVGDLYGELQNPQVSLQLLKAASDIFKALLEEDGPAGNIHNYDDAPQAVALYVQHLNTSGKHFAEAFLAAQALQTFLTNEEANWEHLRGQGWTEELCAEVLTTLEHYLADKSWIRYVEQNIPDSLEGNVWPFLGIAERFNIDLWDTFWPRLIEAPDAVLSWNLAARFVNVERIDQLLDFARAQLDLRELTKPAPSIFDHGPEFDTHHKFGMVLFRLEGYPGKGADFVVAAFSSTAASDRLTAIKTLETWGQAYWTPEILAAAKTAHAHESDADLKQALSKFN